MTAAEFDARTDDQDPESYDPRLDWWEAEVESLNDDLSDCPYYRGEGTCNRGCWSEPECRTGEPREGWPTRAAGDTVEGALLRERRSALLSEIERSYRHG